MPHHITLQCLIRQEFLLMLRGICVWAQRLQLRRYPHPELLKASRPIIDLLFQSSCIDLTKSINFRLLSQKKRLPKRLTCCIFRSATLFAPNSLIAVLSSSERTGRRKKQRTSAQLISSEHYNRGMLQSYFRKSVRRLRCRLQRDPRGEHALCLRLLHLDIRL